MGKTKNVYIISQFNGSTLDVNPETGKPGLFKRQVVLFSKWGLWKKHNWLIEKTVADESEYDDDFVQGEKRATGHLQHIATG